MRVNVLTLGQNVVVVRGQYSGKSGVIRRQYLIADGNGVKHVNIVAIGRLKRSYTDEWLRRIN